MDSKLLSKINNLAKQIDGLDIIKGSPCTIKEVKDVPGGTEITFEWTETNGNIETTTITVADGSSPYVGDNGNWFIDGIDTEVSAKGIDGKSITSITKDENNNLIVTFSDNTTQNIGQLNIDVQADFLTEDGFGKLRYYNGHFQYFNEASSAWVDTSVTP